MRNREICFRPPGKRQIVSSIRVTFIYYNQYIIIIHQVSLSLSFLNLIVVPAVSIKLRSHRITFLILQSIHVHPQVSLSLSLL